MASFSGAFGGAEGSSSSRISTRTVYLAGATGVAAVGLFLLWRCRANQPTKEEVVDALAALKGECASAYAEVASAVERAGPLPPTVLIAQKAAASGGSAAAEKSQESLDKLRQSIEQPLVLGHALQAAADRAASTLWEGATGEDLENQLESWEGEPLVDAGTAELSAMHEACLLGKDDASLLPEDVADGCWEADDALKTLRELGAARIEALEKATAGLSGGLSKAVGESAVEYGAKIVRACSESEEMVWQRLWQNDQVRRRSFGPALVRLSAKDKRFREKRETLERELGSKAARCI